MEKRRYLVTVIAFQDRFLKQLVTIGFIDGGTQRKK